MLSQLIFLLFLLTLGFLRFCDVLVFLMSLVASNLCFLFPFYRFEFSWRAIVGRKTIGAEEWVK